MTTRSRARHFHATAKALNEAAAMRVDDGAVTFSAEVSDLNLQSIIAGVPLDTANPAVLDELLEKQRDHQHAKSFNEIFTGPKSVISADELSYRHEELRWAESKLMQASERLAEAQEQGRKDLVALAVMRRELLTSFAAERAWLELTKTWIDDYRRALSAREFELQELVNSGVRTEQVIYELASVKSEHKIFILADLQRAAQLARIEDSEATSEFHVASEAFDREQTAKEIDELARLRTASTRARRAAKTTRRAASEALVELNIDTSVGEVTAVHAFLIAAFEGDERAQERMSRIRKAQYTNELKQLPEPEAAWKAGLKHPVRFMRARRTTTQR